MIRLLLAVLLSSGVYGYVTPHCHPWVNFKCDRSINSAATHPDVAAQLHSHLRTEELWSALENVFQANSDMDRLDLSRNNLSIVMEDSLRPLTYLRCLNLSRNSLTSLRLGRLDTVHLITLDVSHNLLHFIQFSPRFFRLLDLRLDSNRLATLNATDFLPGVRYLSLSNNIFGDNLDFLKYFDCVTDIVLGNNSITHIDPKVFSFQYLQSVRLDRNYISNLLFLWNFGGLILIDLSHNNITSKEAEVLMEKRFIEVLKMDYNAISDLSFLRNIKSARLEHLSLSHNGIYHIPKDIFKSTRQLRELNLDNNYLSDLEFVSQITALTSLSVQNNNLKKIYGEHLKEGRHSNISKLLLSNNKLSSIDFIVGLNDLKHLEINNNSLTDVPLKYMKHSPLNVLYMENNLLKTAEFIGGLRHLKEVYLGGNDISRVPADIICNTDLQVLSLDSNSKTRVDSTDKFKYIFKMDEHEGNSTIAVYIPYRIYIFLTYEDEFIVFYSTRKSHYLACCGQGRYCEVSEEDFHEHPLYEEGSCSCDTSEVQNYIIVGVCLLIVAIIIVVSVFACFRTRRNKNMLLEF